MRSNLPSGLWSRLSRASPLVVAGSSWRWHVGLSDGVQRKRTSSALAALLSDMETTNRRDAHRQGDYRDPYVQRLRKLGIEFVYVWVSTDAAKQGRVTFSPGTFSGWEWDGAAVDGWLAEFLASRRGINKVAKLSSETRANERHLVIVLDPRSQAGMGITLQESSTALPSLEPPELLTHLWLLPMSRDWPAFHCRMFPSVRETYRGPTGNATVLL